MTGIDRNITKKFCHFSQQKFITAQCENVGKMARQEFSKSLFELFIMSE